MSQMVVRGMITASAKAVHFSMSSTWPDVKSMFIQRKRTAIGESTQ
jgi:hypothetical protein